MNLRKIAIKILIGASALFLAWVVIFIWAQNSEPFEYASTLIRQSSVVRQSVGEVTGVRLERFDSFSIRYSDPKGSARFRTRVSGTNGTAIIYIRLEKDSGKWHVIAASLNGSEIIM